MSSQKLRKMEAKHFQARKDSYDVSAMVKWETSRETGKETGGQTDRQTCALASLASPLLIPLCIIEVGGRPEGMFSFRFD